MLSDEERREIRLADKYENNGPLTKTDYYYQHCATRQVNILRRCEGLTGEAVRKRRRREVQ